MFNDDEFYADKLSCKILSVLIFVLIIALSWLMSAQEANGGETNWKSRYMTVIVTAYCLCEKCTNKKVHDGKTSTNSNAYNPGIAVDPKVIPYGSRIDCAEYTRKPTWAEADDCSKTEEEGGKIIGKHIDLRMTSHQEALKFGRKKAKIQVWIRE